MNLFDMFFGAELGAAEAKARLFGGSDGPDLSLWSQRPQTASNDKLGACETRVGQLHLVVAALIRSLVKQGTINPTELSELMKEIDLEDGKADGQLGERGPDVPEWCPTCKARVARSKTFCVFCGRRFVS